MFDSCRGHCFWPKRQAFHRRALPDQTASFPQLQHLSPGLAQLQTAASFVLFGWDLLPPARGLPVRNRSTELSCVRKLPRPIRRCMRFVHWMEVFRKLATAPSHLLLAPLLGLIFCAPSAGSASALRGATTCKVRPSSNKVLVDQAVAVTGTLYPPKARPVLLGAGGNGSWLTYAQGTATRAGVFRVRASFAFPASLRLAIYAPRFNGAAAISCPPFWLEVLARPSQPALPVRPSRANSFRAVYALASDQTADRSEVSGIVHVIKVVNDWFAIQTRGSVLPRWVRARNPDGSAGDPVVTTVRLRHTVAQFKAAPDPFALVASDLASVAPPAAPTEKTVVWIDAGADECGRSGSKLSVLFESACPFYPSSSAKWPRQGGTYLLAHEMTHAFGAVPRCAPHSDGTGHVNDDRRDLLYQGPEGTNWDRDWKHLTLDPDHDDYYATGQTNCTDIARSAFWTVTSAISS
jgi:hypothetical protein